MSSEDSRLKTSSKDSKAPPSSIGSSASKDSVLETNIPSKSQSIVTGPDDKIAPKKSSKEMSKAERRALQEKQRAEKESRKQGGNSAPPAKGVKKPVEALNSKSKAGKVEASSNTCSSTAENSKQVTSSRGIGLFSHLDGGLTGRVCSVSIKEVHPAIVELAMQIKSYAISGSNARCIAMLRAFKRTISDYSTPPQTHLCRHLVGHLSPMIKYLIEASGRPLAMAMGNAIRYLKREISTVDPDLPEEDAKIFLMDQIENFIRVHIIVADQIIATNAIEKIQPQDVILTYGGSSVVLQTFEVARAKGIDFRVVIVDAGPHCEGKHMLRRLVQKGVECTYVPLTGVAYIAKEATKVFLGAHGLLSNGTLLARAGTAMVALAGHHQRLPVIVCCETYKFSDKAQLDSFVWNEIGNPSDLYKTPGLDTAAISAQAATDEVHQIQAQEESLLESPNLNFLNLLYDLTPADYISVVVTEVGLIPCTSVPVVLREYAPLIQ